MQILFPIMSVIVVSKYFNSLFKGFFSFFWKLQMFNVSAQLTTSLAASPSFGIFVCLWSLPAGGKKKL